MKVTIQPGTAWGSAAAVPSKSYAHRLLLACTLVGGASTVDSVPWNEDIAATLDCIRALGLTYERTGDSVTVRPGERSAEERIPFSCRESASTLRFFLPIALAKKGEAVFTGSRRLMQRGVTLYESVLGGKGVRFRKEEESLSVRGSLPAGRYEIRGDVSSQFISGLLFALPLVNGDSVLRVLPPVESRPYIDLTLDVLSRFGVRIRETEPNCFLIPGNQCYRSVRERVEGDWSHAASLLALNLAGGNVRVTGLNPDSRQGDRICVSLLEEIERGCPTIDLSDCPDLGPVLFAAAALKNGALFTGTARLKIKESDRASAMAQEMEKFGIRMDVEENTVRVYPGQLTQPTRVLRSHGDHRIVMALCLPTSVVGGEIEDVQAIRKSDPCYFDTLTRLGLKITVSDGDENK